MCGYGVLHWRNCNDISRFCERYLELISRHLKIVVKAFRDTRRQQGWARYPLVLILTVISPGVQTMSQCFLSLMPQFYCSH